MLTAKKKIAVREAVPQSKTVLWWEKIQNLYSENVRIFWGAIVGIIAIVILFYVYVSGKEADELEAGRHLRVIQPLLQQQQYKTAIIGDPGRGVIGLKEITEKYSGTSSGQLACLYLGNAYLFTNEFDKAIKVYDDASPSSALLESAVYAGIAGAYEGKKDYIQAAEFYVKAAKTYQNDHLTANRYFNAGRMYCIAGDKEHASSMFEKVKEANTPRFEKEIERLTAQYELE